MACKYCGCEEASDTNEPTYRVERALGTIQMTKVLNDMDQDGYDVFFIDFSHVENIFTIIFERRVPIDGSLNIPTDREVQSRDTLAKDVYADIRASKGR